MVNQVDPLNGIAMRSLRETIAGSTAIRKESLAAALRSD
jgi:hypothetical protein